MIAGTFDTCFSKTPSMSYLFLSRELAYTVVPQARLRTLAHKDIPPPPQKHHRLSRASEQNRTAADASRLFFRKWT